MRNGVWILAEELPEHETARGDEFRDISVEGRLPIARTLMTAKSQASGNDADWEDALYRRSMRKKKNLYFYQCGQLGIDMRQAQSIWWSVVHDDPSPMDRVSLI